MKKKYFNSKIIYITLLFLSSFFFNFYYGYIGVYPIDSFLIYNSGYNVLNGSHPFKDYWSITGPLLDYLQAIFFFIFGINWFSYVLHASVINLILALFSYFVFKEIGNSCYFSRVLKFFLHKNVLSQKMKKPKDCSKMVKSSLI